MKQYRGDREYATEFRKEVDFLKERNISYTYVRVKEHNSSHKYRNSKELFEALFIFYSNVK